MKDRVKFLKWLLKRCIDRIKGVDEQINEFPDYGSYTRTLDIREYTHPQEFEAFSRLYDARHFWVCCRNDVLKDITQYID